jgi:two-component system response regulator DesR
MTDRIRILIAEDQTMVREALVSLLRLEEDFEVVCEVGNGGEVLPGALKASPDIALLDIEMPGMSGLAAARLLREQLPACKVIIITTFGRGGYLREAMESGAAAFVLKDAPAAELSHTIRRVLEGERIVDPDLALTALSEGENPLTKREREVLKASLDGVTVADMAAKFYLSEGTVRNYLSEAIQKMNAQNRVEAARLAENKGWL